MSRNKQVDKLLAGMEVLGIRPGAGIVPVDTIECALAMLKRDQKLIEILQLERNTAVAQHTKLNAMWLKARAKYNVANMQLGYMRLRLIDIEMAKLERS